MTEESTARDSIFLSSYSCVSVDDIDFSLIRISSAITKVQPACAKTWLRSRRRRMATSTFLTRNLRELPWGKDLLTINNNEKPLGPIMKANEARLKTEIQTMHMKLLVNT